ncbi:Precursor of CEP14 [Heracleum sosnowskyi]|uniref:Precursor of CEP14 n=1 Tax=Heracleum sosnowskyi TaxID=360622 RepID=A0AAD8I4D9_9APIA|nr:Precursor of CEP14 [Heracleum sosnowskyi]
MARSSVIFLLYLVTLASFVTTIHGRKLNNSMHENKKQQLQQQSYPPPPPSSQDSLYLSSLPKGTVPSSAPSKQHHSFVVDEKLIARHLAALDRMLRSVPSPGVGH